MAVLDRSSQHSVTTAVLYGQCFAVILLALHILFTASMLASTTGTRSGIGPIKIYELSRQALAGGGFSGSIRFLGAGLLFYFGLMACVSVFVHYVRRLR